LSWNKSNTQDFIQKAKKKHGDTYDYSKVNYIDATTKVIIGCSIHGDFSIMPSKHTARGDGCRDCSYEKRARARSKSREQFIIDARKIHGDKYDYSKVVYKNDRTDVIIICPRHGEFPQSPNAHLRSQGCRNCGYEKIGGERAHTLESFIKLSRSIHGDKFDYSKVIYKNNRTDVIIICPIHGDFTIKPGKHYGSIHGCNRCSHDAASANLVKNNEYFIEKSRSIHGDKFDYSISDYQGAHKEIKIICRIHGILTTTPGSHYRGHGCMKCGREGTSTKRTKTTEQFILEAQEVHGNKYDYSQTKYTGIFDNVNIICPEHGKFPQSGSNHLRGSGCPTCAETGFDQSKPAYVYQIRFHTRNNGVFYKCGITNRDYMDRTKKIISSYKKHYDDAITINVIDYVHFEDGSVAWNFERKLKTSGFDLGAKFFSKKFDGVTETYAPSVIPYWNTLKFEMNNL